MESLCRKRFCSYEMLVWNAIYLFRHLVERFIRKMYRISEYFTLFKWDFETKISIAWLAWDSYLKSTTIRSNDDSATAWVSSPPERILVILLEIMRIFSRWEIMRERVLLIVLAIICLTFNLQLILCLRRSQSIFSENRWAPYFPCRAEALAELLIRIMMTFLFSISF